jgi:hypothetical protein
VSGQLKPAMPHIRAALPSLPASTPVQLQETSNDPTL